MTPVAKKGVLALEMHDILLAPMSQVRTFYVALLPDFYFQLVTFCPYIYGCQLRVYTTLSSLQGGTKREKGEGCIYKIQICKYTLNLLKYNNVP